MSDTPRRTKRILLARIGRAHGVRGEVVVQSFAAEPASLVSYGPLTDETGARSFVLSLVRETPRGLIVRIAGVADRTAAERLSGLGLYVEREQLPPPGDGEFYHDDLIGLAAVSPEGQAIGEIVGVHNFGAGDLLEVRLAGTATTEFVAFKPAFVPDVDLANGRAVVRLPAADEDDGAAPVG